MLVMLGICSGKPSVDRGSVSEGWLVSMMRTCAGGAFVILRSARSAWRRTLEMLAERVIFWAS